jgi:hypothetical protein
VAQCFDHLAITNRLYLDVMKEPAVIALKNGKLKKRPCAPGMIGRWFVRSMEPPVRSSFKMKAPRSIKPHAAPTLADAYANFENSHGEVCKFLKEYSGLDLASIGFPNPFIKGIRFSLATGLFVIAAHERRHLWQAWRVRHAAEDAAVSLRRI